MDLSPIAERCLVMTTKGRALCALFYVKAGERGTWNGESHYSQFTGWVCVPPAVGFNPESLENCAAVYHESGLIRIDGYESLPFNLRGPSRDNNVIVSYRNM